MVRVRVRVRVNPYPNPNHNQPEESHSNQSEVRIPDLFDRKKDHGPDGLRGGPTWCLLMMSFSFPSSLGSMSELM